MEDRQLTENKKYCAVLSIGAGLLAGTLALRKLGSAGIGNQMIYMYVCAAAALLLTFVCYKVLVKLFGSKELFNVSGQGGEADAGNSPEEAAGEPSLAELSPEEGKEEISEESSKEIAEDSRDGFDTGETLEAKPSRLYGIISVLVCTVVLLTIPDILDVLTIEYAVGGYITAYFVCVVLACLVIQSVRGGEGGAAKLAVAVSIAFSMVVYFFYSYIPNPFNQSIWEIHHYNALEQTLHNVAFNVPVTPESSGIYGHYALFAWPILKLFGHGPLTIAFFFTGGLLLSQVFFTLAVFKVTKSNMLRACAILASAAACLNQYYGAVWPVRTLWPYIVLTYTLYIYDSPRADKKPWLYWGIIGYVLCGLAILWSTDSGIVATAAYTFCIWLRVWRGDLPFSKKAMKTYALTLLGCMGSVLLMVALINIYNLLCGGPLVFKVCFFPMIGGNGYVSGLQDTMSNFSEMFYLPTVIFLLSIFVGVLSLRGIGACVTDRLPLAFCGLMGLGESYYYFNRSNASWDCVTAYMILCLVLLAGFVGKMKRTPGNLYSAMKKGTGFASMFFLCTIFYVTMYGAPNLLNYRVNREINTMDSFYGICDVVEKEVPKDTYAYGYMTQQIYAQLGWDPGYHNRDSSDMFGDGIENVFEEMSRQDMMLVSGSNMSVVREHCPDMYIIKQLSYVPEPEYTEAGFSKIEIDPESRIKFNLMQRFMAGDVLIDESDITVDKTDDEQIVEFPLTVTKDTMYDIKVEFADAEYESLQGKISFVTGGGDEEETLKEADLTTVEDLLTGTSIYTSDMEEDSLDVTMRLTITSSENSVGIDKLSVTRMIPAKSE